MKHDSDFFQSLNMDWSVPKHTVFDQWQTRRLITSAILLILYTTITTTPLIKEVLSSLHQNEKKRTYIFYNKAMIIVMKMV